MTGIEPDHAETEIRGAGHRGEEQTDNEEGRQGESMHRGEVTNHSNLPESLPTEHTEYTEGLLVSVYSVCSVGRCLRAGGECDQSVMTRPVAADSSAARQARTASRDSSAVITVGLRPWLTQVTK